MEKSKCDNCGWVGEPLHELGDIVDLFERIDEGSIVPSGECPKCDSLCYPFPSPIKVKIEVIGGVATCTVNSHDVSVEIQDHDNEKTGH